MALIKDQDWADVANSYQKNPERAFARMLHYCAMDGFNAHTEAIKKAFDLDKVKGSHMLVGLYAEYLALFMHLVSRKAHEILGPENVAKIQSALLPYIAENAQNYYEGDISAITRTILALANNREDEYAGCLYFASPKNLFFDDKAIKNIFNKHISLVLGRDPKNPLDVISSQTETSIGLLSFFSFINLSEWLKGPAMRLGIAQYDDISLAPPGIKI